MLPWPSRSITKTDHLSPTRCRTSRARHPDSSGCRVPAPADAGDDPGKDAGNDPGKDAGDDPGTVAPATRRDESAAARIAPSVPVTSM
jgi:hypothetical protein